MTKFKATLPSDGEVIQGISSNKTATSLMAMFLSDEEREEVEALRDIKEVGARLQEKLEVEREKILSSVEKEVERDLMKKGAEAFATLLKVLEEKKLSYPTKKPAREKVAKEHKSSVVDRLAKERAFYAMAERLISGAALKACNTNLVHNLKAVYGKGLPSDRCWLESVGDDRFVGYTNYSIEDLSTLMVEAIAVGLKEIEEPQEKTTPVEVEVVDEEE